MVATSLSKSLSVISGMADKPLLKQKLHERLHLNVG